MIRLLSPISLLLVDVLTYVDTGMADYEEATSVLVMLEAKTIRSKAEELEGQGAPAIMALRQAKVRWVKSVLNQE